MIDLTDPSATDVREALRSHAHDVGDPSLDLATRVERRARTLRRQRAFALGGGVAVVVAAALAVPLSLSGSSGAGSRITRVPPGSTTAVPIVETDPTTWPFRGDARIGQALIGNATTAVGLIDRTTRLTLVPLFAGSAPYGDRYLAFLAVPADSSKSVMFGVYQQPTSGTGFLIRPYDIGPAGQIDHPILNAALRTGSIDQVPVLVAPGSSAAISIRHRSGAGQTVTEACEGNDGFALCYAGDVKTDQVRATQSGHVVASDEVHWDSQD